MTEQERIARAEQDLEKHRDLMIRLWGENYQTHPLYTEAVRKVAAARMPYYVLEDYCY
jgi:hypothetical protein